MAENTVHDANFDLARIAQQAQGASAEGDALGRVLDPDIVGLDFGL